ncbi:MAG: ABC transporter ATP-binding protein, partial [Candidatus Contendobacter sp.]|nr:ABC transporter ATP-binding protein [Candidatus Contendobacter sp.]
HLPPQQRNVAMVFQDYALYPHMTVRGNLEFPLKMRNRPRPEIARQVAWAAELLSLGALLDRFPKQLSGGQRQRVAMGRALVREPAAFLMDEPLSNLDSRLRVQIRSELSELLDRLGATTLYVTHDQSEAMTLGDRVAVMNQGRLQQVAPPQALYERPANTFVAGFIGNPPMNLFPVRVTSAGDGGQLRLGEQTMPLPAPMADRQWDGLLTAGLRPEHLRLASEETQNGLHATVSVTEYLGHETLLYARISGMDAPGSTLVTRLPGIQIFHPGDTVRLSLDPMHLHFFGGDGAALDHGSADTPSCR